MNAFFSSVSLLALCGPVLLLGGCEVKDCKTEEGKDAVCAESLSVYNGTPETLTADYADGAQVNVRGLFGDVLVTVGAPGVVAAKFSPFNYRSHEEEASARRELTENLDLAVEKDASGNVTISVARRDATSGLGSHITLELPPEFNGPLVVENAADGVLNTGAVDVSFVGDSTTLNVVNGGLENCNILRGTDGEPVDPTALTNVDVRCGADITVRGVNDDVIVHSTAEFHSDVFVEIASISAASNGGRISGEDTTIEVVFPASDSFTVAASIGEGASIKALALPAACEASEDTATSKTFSCGTGVPVYEVSTQDADADDDDASFIRVLVK